MFSALKTTWQEFWQDDCSTMAAALAYYSAFSLAPLLILVIWICGAVWDPNAVEGRIGSEIASVAGEDGAEQIKTMLRAANESAHSRLASLMSAGALLFGATGMIVQLQSSLNRAWDVQPDPDDGGVKHFVVKRLLSASMIVAVAFLLLVSLVVSAALSAVGDKVAVRLPDGASESMVHVINAASTATVFTLLFATMFRLLPDATVRWRDVWLGAVVTAALFIIGKYAIGTYLGSRNMESTYGAAASLLLVLVWIYYSAMILLFGAEFTQVWARRNGRRIQPADGAVRMSTHQHVTSATVGDSQSART